MKRVVVATVFAALVAATAGCSTDPERVIEPGCGADPFPPPYAEVSPCSAPEVLHAAVTTLYQLDPIAGLDARSMFEAAEPLMRAAFAADARVAVSMWAPITTVQWQDWVARRVPLRTDVRVTDDDHPPDTATSSSRVLSVRLTPADHTPIVFAVYARSTRLSAERAWLLADVQVLL
ncbi:hypothetical protein [Nocardia sp. NPDC058666]|uniref:hypothetical protein n=1 Tax=unclassified Nocardia TaxID=2637762 RepID=UPI00364D8A9B